MIRLTEEPLDPLDALAFVADQSAGGIVLFSGSVRNHSDAGPVTGMEYEAWPERVTACLEAFGDEMFDRWPVRKVALLHRIGHLGVGEISVLVCCSAPHRADAFEAARHGIERIKETAPIWKKETMASGDAHWVMGS
jgi:molybdopterin synthase catalytic subunit